MKILIKNGFIDDGSGKNFKWDIEIVRDTFSSIENIDLKSYDRHLNPNAIL